MPTLARRDLLKLLALGILTPVRMVAATPESLPSAALVLSRTSAHAGSAKLVGQVYLEHRPLERDVNLLLRHIAGVLGTAHGAVSRADDPLTLVPALRRAIEADFEAGRWVNLEGWLVAETEGRVCALQCLI